MEHLTEPALYVVGTNMSFRAESRNLRHRRSKDRLSRRQEPVLADTTTAARRARLGTRRLGAECLRPLGFARGDGGRVHNCPSAHCYYCHHFGNPSLRSRTGLGAGSEAAITVTTSASSVRALRPQPKGLRVGTFHWRGARIAYEPHAPHPRYKNDLFSCQFVMPVATDTTEDESVLLVYGSRSWAYFHGSDEQGVVIRS